MSHDPLCVLYTKTSSDNHSSSSKCTLYAWTLNVRGAGAGRKKHLRLLELSTPLFVFGGGGDKLLGNSGGSILKAVKGLKAAREPPSLISRVAYPRIVFAVSQGHHPYRHAERVLQLGRVRGGLQGPLYSHVPQRGSRGRARPRHHRRLWRAQRHPLVDKPHAVTFTVLRWQRSVGSCLFLREEELKSQSPFGFASFFFFSS